MRALCVVLCVEKSSDDFFNLKLRKKMAVARSYCNGTPVFSWRFSFRARSIYGHDLFSAVDKDVSGYANGVRPPQRDNVITVCKRHVISYTT